MRDISATVLADDRTTAMVNGVVVTDFRERDPVPAKHQPFEPERGRRPDVGYIGLQNHGPQDVVMFARSA